MTTATNNSNIWRWGNPENAVHLSQFPKLKLFLEKKFGVKLSSEINIPTFKISPSRFNESDLKNIFSELKQNQISLQESDRLRFTFGKSYYDVIRMLTSQKFFSPDFILFPETIKEISHILKQAAEHKIKIITFGGGSNVVGAFDSTVDTPVCVLNMERLNRLIEIDFDSHTATFETGIFGPQLEKILNEKGFTLGHFPQSFEFSTLGGWLALRSAGQESGLYGKIEDIVLQMKIVTPVGIIENIGFPRHACGPDFHHLFLGSEGTLGIIAQAKLRIHKKPEKYFWKIALFKNFETGAEALQEIIQSGIHPAVARLSDIQETQLSSLISHTEKNGLQKIIQSVMKSWLKSKGYGEPCVLMMRFAVKNESDYTAAKVVSQITKKHGAQKLPSSVAASWESTRFSLPYLRDTLVEHGVLIDTFETVTYWKNLIPIYNHIKNALKSKSDFFDKGGILLCHISHVYETGASLYFTMIAPQKKENEIQQWQQFKKIVSDAIFENGGAISHHHGIGKDHQSWYLQQLNPETKKLLQAIKNHLDPENILNPGKLIDAKSY